MTESTSAASAAPASTTITSSNPASSSAENTKASTASSAEEKSSSSDNKEQSKQASTEKKIEEVKKNLKKYKIKVDKEEIEESLDLDNEEEVKKHLQLSKVAQKRMNEKAALEKEVAQFFQLLKDDPEAVLSDKRIGVDVKQFAAKILEDEIKKAQKTPEQLEQEALKKKLKEYESNDEKRQKQEKDREFDELKKHESVKYEQQVDDALKTANLPKTSYVVDKITNYMLTALKHNVNDIQPKDVMDLVKQDMEKDIRSFFEAAPTNVIKAILGDNILGKIAQDNIGKAGEVMSTKNIAADVGNLGSSNEAPSKKIKLRDFLGKV